jgi:hypothetical protein
MYFSIQDPVSHGIAPIPYGWPCIDGKICNGNFITGPYWNEQSKNVPDKYTENMFTVFHTSICCIITQLLTVPH